MIQRDLLKKNAWKEQRFRSKCAKSRPHTLSVHLPRLIVRYYDLVTDNYEGGWGQNFHYCPFPVSHLPIRAMMQRHNHYLAHWLSLRPGMRILDVGCGVGEPGREIARFAGCKVVGLNINEYQIQRATQYTKEAGLEHLCTYVQGDFMKMPFEDESFDAVFAIEVLCQAPNLQKAYEEILRVLKKGGKFGFYEEVMTDKFDVNIPEHRKIRGMIERGTGIATMQTASEAKEAVRAAGFVVEFEEDTGNIETDPLKWYWPLEGKTSLTRDWHDWRIVFGLTWGVKFFVYYLVWVLEKIGIEKRGTLQTLDILHHCVNGYRGGGRLGIFTPLLMIISKKPERKNR